MCYLPDIIALQKMLTDRFSRRIDRERANQLKIREFLQGLPKGPYLYTLLILLRGHLVPVYMCHATTQA